MIQQKTIVDLKATNNSETGKMVRAISLAADAREAALENEIAELKSDNETLVSVNNILSNEILEVNKELAELKASNELLHDALESNQISEKELLSYRAHINDLREALEFYNDAEFPYSIANDALSSTPAQSMIKHDNEVIERCAQVCENILNESFSKPLSFDDIAIAIRALKGEL